MITTGSFAKFIWPGVNSAYGMEYAKWPVIYSQIFDVEKSTKPYEEDVGITGLGLAYKKTEGQGVRYDDMAQGFVDRYQHAVYALGFIITMEAYKDGLGPAQGVKKARSTAFSLRTTQETVGANVLNRAFNSSYTFGDGKELCATDHPHKSGGTWRNELSTAADLSEASLEQALIDIGGFTNDRNLKINILADKLIIPRELEFEAERILKSALRVETTNNDINAIRSLGKFPGGVVINPYLTDTDAWFIKTNCPDGMKYFEREPMTFDTADDFDTKNFKAVGMFRGSFGCTDKRSIFGSPGA